MKIKIWQLTNTFFLLILQFTRCVYEVHATLPVVHYSHLNILAPSALRALYKLCQAAGRGQREIRFCVVVLGWTSG